MILGSTIKFLVDDKCLRNILVLNKDTHQQVKKAVYKQALLHSQPERLKSKRLLIWENILHFSSKHIDYEALKQKVLQDSKAIANVEEVINMDV